MPPPHETEDGLAGWATQWRRIGRHSRTPPRKCLYLVDVDSIVLSPLFCGRGHSHRIGCSMHFGLVLLWATKPSIKQKHEVLNRVDALHLTQARASSSVLCIAFWLEPAIDNSSVGAKNCRSIRELDEEALGCRKEIPLVTLFGRH